MVTAKLSTLMSRIKYPIDKDACWEWCGYVGKNGYGFLSIRPHGSQPAHRVVYETFVGEIPKGLLIDHLCRNKKCVKPDHLEPVTRSVNALRAVMKSRNRTHCIHGHEFTSENTLLRKGRAIGTQRECRKCAKLRIEKFNLRRKEQNNGEA
jgi:hypothetical protein